ncbi:GGDEF domain-containing protein [Aliikangiella marina]|uniref:diguanylate cyclase n=1 Tax=Aliikangiella marina TaxID=1712262 RepID=A0A545TI77_9GAMM|nr:GGDEF domain-containing protein [Aliikangiella marina]TQV76922.1 GGDEF domain-containing protein [Aliikangiella marina]
MDQQRLEDIKAAGLKSRSAMMWLRDNQLPAEPICYTIAYEYLHTDNQALKDDVDKLDTTSETISEELDKVFKDHVASKHYKDLAMQSGRTSQYVNELLKLLIKNFDNNEDLTEVIDGAKKYLADNDEEFEFDEQESYLKTKEYATRDELTELLDEQGFLVTLKEALLAEENHPFSLIFMDVDKFAMFIQTNGKVMGDAMLKHIAKLLANYLKGGDIISRFEEDKFCIALPKASVEQGVKVADEIRKKVAGVSLKKKTGLTVAKVTVSLGVTEIKPGISIAQGLEKAKVALNRSIDLGRNCVNRD